MSPLTPGQAQAIKSLQSIIWLNSLWKTEWIDRVPPGEWARQCLQLLTTNEWNELESLKSTCAARRLPIGVMTNLRWYAINEFDLTPRVFDYVLIEFIKVQLCQTKK